MKTKMIEIDTETNSLIERERRDFSEMPNDIIKRCLGSTLSKTETLEVSAPTKAAFPSAEKPITRSRTTRSTGSYDFELLGKEYSKESLKSAYVTCLRAMKTRDAQFYVRLSEETTNARRLIARDPTALYIKTPSLAERHAEKLDGEWYVDLNLSEQQVIQRLKTACRVAGLNFERDLKLRFAP